MSNSNIYDRDDVILDPRLEMPADIIGVRAGIPEEMENSIGETAAGSSLSTQEMDVFDISDVSYDSIAEDIISDEEDYKYYPPPNGMTIISQTVRISPDGTHVTDIVFEVTGGVEPGEYEARVSKI